MAVKNEQALALMDTYPALSPRGGELAAILQENLGPGVEIGPGDLPRIKMPSGGGKFWEIRTTQGPQAVAELQAVVLYSAMKKAFWHNQNAQNGSPPDCYSDDMLHGIGNPGGECAACPFNAFGTRRFADGTSGGGKACKDSRILWLLLPDSPLPVQLRLPPTSLQPSKQYLLDLSLQGRLYWQVVTRIGLRQVEGAQAYSVATFAEGEPLDAPTLAAMQALRDNYVPQLQRMRVAETSDAA